MTTKFNIGELVWYVDNEYEFSSWERAKPYQAHVERIEIWKSDGSFGDRKDELKIKYILDAKPSYSRCPWEFMEDRIFKTHADALYFRNQKRRAYLQKEIDKAQKVVDGWKKQLEEV
jgi:hypothetical protein